MELIKIQIALALLCVIESVLEKYVIAMKSETSPNYSKNNELEHIWSAAYFAAVLLSFIVLKPSVWPLIFVAPFIRLVFFGNLLNKLRGKDWFYLSDRGLDKVLKNSIGGNGLFILCVVVITVFNIVTWM